MNISQLESYNLGDAVKFHTKLNPELWDRREHLHPEVRDQLLKIADDFATFLGVDNIDIEDITVSGSNAAYTYTKHSDIDLHLVVRRPEDPVYRELFNSKKHIYNKDHDIEIHGIPVELYVQDYDQPAVSQGIYSVLNSDWLEVPRRQRAVIDDVSVRGRYESLQRQIKEAIATNDSRQIDRLFKKLKRLRQTGLDQNGEFGPENLAYKMLRSQGYIDRLATARSKARSEELSLDELASQPVRYGYSSQLDEVGITPDGTNPTTCQIANEAESDPTDTIKEFVEFCRDYLGIERNIKLSIKTDPTWSQKNSTFGRYNPDANVLEVSLPGRHIMDTFRTIAHELTHLRQHELSAAPEGAGDTGSEWENQANAMAGIIMREWGRSHPAMFTVKESSGYIPTAAQANDPRFSMALTQDVRPGATGRAANALKLNTDKQGHPQIARTNGLVSRLQEEFKRFQQ